MLPRALDMQILHRTFMGLFRLKLLHLNAVRMLWVLNWKNRNEWINYDCISWLQAYPWKASLFIKPPNTLICRNPWAVTSPNRYRALMSFGIFWGRWQCLPEYSSFWSSVTEISLGIFSVCHKPEPRTSVPCSLCKVTIAVLFKIGWLIFPF